MLVLASTLPIGLGLAFTALRRRLRKPRQA
jgi:hypothetical protein